MRYGVRPMALAVGILTIVAFSGIVQAHHNPSWDGKLEVGKMPGTPERMCDPYEECQELRGITIQDFDVSEYMKDRNEPADYTVKDVSSYQPITIWRVCKYDGQNELIECDEEGPFWYLWGDIPVKTDTIRIILKQNAGVHYTFSVTSN